MRESSDSEIGRSFVAFPGPGAPEIEIGHTDKGVKFTTIEFLSSCGLDIAWSRPEYHSEGYLTGALQREEVHKKHRVGVFKKYALYHVGRPSVILWIGPSTDRPIR